MTKLMRSILSPLFSIALMMLGNGFFQTYISVRLQDAGESALIIGLVQSAYYAGFMIGAIKIEDLIHRIRHIRAFAFFASILTATIMIQGLFVEAYSWMVLRLIGGLCTASLYVVVESWLLIVSPQKKRGAVLSYYMIALYSAQAFCQFFIDVVQIQSQTAYLIAGGFLALSIFPVTFTRSPTPELADAPHLKAAKVLLRAPFGCLGCVFAGIVLSAIYTFTPIYAQNTEISVSMTMFLTVAGGFLLQWPLGYLSDIFDRHKTLIAVSFALILPTLGIAMATGNEGFVYALSFILGGLAFTIYPLSITQVCDRFEEESITSVTGVLLLFYSAGSVVGPLIAPYFIAMFDPVGLYIFLSGASLLLCAFGAVTLLFTKPVPKEEQGEFVPVRPVTTVSGSLDPRDDDEEIEP